MTTDEAREHLFAEICLAEGDEDTIARAMTQRLSGLDLPPEIRAELEANAPRLLLYRRLVRATLESAARRMLPRTAACLDASRGFSEEFGAFLHEEGPRTHHLRDIGVEFVRWATPRWAPPGFPPWLADIARYEVLELEVGIVQAAPTPATEDTLSLDRPLVFDPTARLARFEHAVHEASEPPAARAVALLVYRDRENAVHSYEIAPTVASVVARLLEGEALGDAVRAAAGGGAQPVDDTLLAQTAEALAALAEEGILLGAST